LKGGAPWHATRRISRLLVPESFNRNSGLGIAFFFQWRVFSWGLFPTVFGQTTGSGDRQGLELSRAGKWLGVCLHAQ
jgi:hypothetical protein